MKNKFFCVVVGLITFFLFETNAYCISKIEVNNNPLSPLFDPYIYIYNVYVENTNEVNLTVVNEESDKIVSYDKIINLTGEVTQAKVTVLKKDDTYYEYIINIFKDYNSKIDSGDSTLSKLVIEGYNIDFSKDKINYEINIESSVEQLNITYEPTNSNSKVIVKGNNALKENSNTVTIEVISEDNKNKSIYIINVNKLKSVFNEQVVEEKERNIFNKTELTEEENKIVIIALITISVVLIFFTLYLLFFSRKK